MFSNSVISSAQFTHRWGGDFIAGKRRNIAEHSFEVGMHTLNILKMIERDGNIGQHHFKVLSCDALGLALVHDLPEIITGDVKFPVKQKYPTLRSELDTVEKDFFAESGIDTNFDLAAKFIVKVADIVAVMAEIEDEIRLGNFPVTARDVIYELITAMKSKYRIVGLSSVIYNIGANYLVSRCHNINTPKVLDLLES